MLYISNFHNAANEKTHHPTTKLTKQSCSLIMTSLHINVLNVPLTSLCGEADDDWPFGDPGLAQSISPPAFSTENK